eukprot:TCONS_00008039-protein
MVCGSKANGRCRKEYFPDLIKEIERRHFMEEKIKWDFRALDKEDNGRISLESALFLFKAVHGEKFSQRYWNLFADSRLDPYEDVYFDEIKLFLCNIPEYASSNGDQEYFQQQLAVRENAKKLLEEEHQILEKIQHDESKQAAMEQAKIEESNRLKQRADNLLNRMDEIGIEALLEDDMDLSEYGGRAKEKVTVTEILDALKHKYMVLREKLLGEMLRTSIGNGMWQTLSEHEQHQKLLQLKMKEEKLRREGKLETMAIHLPGASTAVQYNVFGLMGESEAELEQRITDQNSKVEESGLSLDEVASEFSKKLDTLEQSNSTTDHMLLDLNKRFTLEYEILSKKLQGLSHYQSLTPAQRERYLFSLVQARLRGVQENEFVAASLTVGLSERIQPQKNDRSQKDPAKHSLLSESRLKQNKARRSYDGPVVPPRLFPLKSKFGRVDYVLQLVQECERRYALEREFLLSASNSREFTMHRSSARGLTEDERQRQLQVLLAQRQGWRDHKTSKEKISASQQNRGYLTEAFALKFESLKHEMEEKEPKSTRDSNVLIEILAALQRKQDGECQKILDVGSLSKGELEGHWHEQTNAILEEWFDNVAAILFGILETSPEEEELLKALNDKYDSLRDKLLLDSLMNQFGKSEWDRLSEQERQNQLAKMRMLEKKLRREGKYDELAKLLGDAANDSDALGKLMGENRQKYLDQLNERLRNRQRRIDNGEDPDDLSDDDQMMDEKVDKSSGNLLKDLDNRFENERDALLRKLREEQDRQARERERQAELARLRMEARKAERESNFDGAALVLGLAERNKAALEDRLKSDRERQEQLARERLAARRNRKKSSKDEDEVDPIQPDSDDITGWQDSVLKELERKHSKERNLLLDLLQEGDSEDFRQEAREMSMDDRNKRLATLRAKREQLDLTIKGEQEEHIPILEMALAVKYVSCVEKLKREKAGNESDVTPDDVIISMTADLQQLQDEETKGVLESLQAMNVEELSTLRQKQIDEQKCGRSENVATLAFRADSETADGEIVKALDQKYNTLLDKLLLEAMEKQMGKADWALLNEQERQRLIMKKRLEQKRLLREGKFDEAAKLLGDGFKTEASLNNLMGENRKKYQELLEQRLRDRKEKIARGEPVDDLAMEELPESEDALDGDQEAAVDPKKLLEDLQKRYDSEKDELLSRLQGSDKRYMNEKDRQAELLRLKREQRRAQQEEKFGAAALVFGLAERNQNAAKERLKNDRSRQEQLARERLERLRNKKNSVTKAKDEENDVVIEEGGLENLVKMLEKRHELEQNMLVELYGSKDAQLLEEYDVMSLEQRQSQLNSLSTEAENEEKYEEIIKEMVSLKHCNRHHALTSQNKNERCSDDQVLVTIMADLQLIQDKESEQLLQKSLDMNEAQIKEEQQGEIKICQTKCFKNLIQLLAAPEAIKQADKDTLVEALESKYDVLKDKLILDALEKQMGASKWAEMNERERQRELLKLKLQQKKLQQEGKIDEASRLMGNLLKNDANVQSLLGASKEEQEKRLKERLEKRKQRKDAGMSEEEITELEQKEETEFEEEVAKKSTGNALQDLQKNFDAEKEALMGMLSNADTRMNNERKRQLELARLRREARKAQAEEKFDAAALVLGAAKSNQAALDASLKGARNRQEQLARERIQALKNKRQQQRAESSETKEDPSESDDPIQVQENILSTMEKHHSNERELLVEITSLQQQPDSEHRKNVKEMSPDQQNAKLFELSELRKKMNKDGSLTNEEQKSIFEEAAAIKMEQLHVTDDTKSDEEHTVKLLADLQDKQDREASNIMKDLDQKGLSTMKQILQLQNNAYQKNTNDNLASVLLSQPVEPVTDALEEELVKALKEKYDAVKDKIFEEALKAKFGEAKWAAMSEKEKQENLLAMRAMNEFNLDDEDSINNLDSIALPGMEKIIGKTRAKQDKKMRERMEKRKRAKAEGKSLDEIENEEKEEDENTEADIQNGSQALVDLQKQYEADKDAILSMMKTTASKESSERERQLALAKLRRDAMKIKREKKYDGAALVLNLAKTNQAKKDASLENERGRQEQLARERIATRKKKLEEQRTQKENESESAGEKTEAEKLEDEENQDQKDDLSEVEQLQREGTTIAKQDAVIGEMEKKHENEQNVLLDLVNSIDNDPVAMETASKIPADERAEKLNLMSIQRKKLKEKAKVFIDSQPPENQMSEDEKKNFNDTLVSTRSDQSHLLKEALSLKMVETRDNLKADPVLKDSGEEKLKEEVSVKMMADLQERQTVENNALLQAMAQSDNEMLDKMKNDQRKARRCGFHDNIAVIMFGDDKQKKKRKSETEIEKELEKEIEDEDASMQAEAQVEMEQFQAEMEKEKEEKKLSSMSDDEMKEYMKQLKQREEEKRQALQDQIEKQRQRAKERMLEKRRKRDEKEFESDMASAMIVNAQKRSNMLREKTMAMQGAQKDSLEERLRKRREERKRKQEEEAEQARQAEEAEKQRQKVEEEAKKRKEEEGNNNEAEPGTLDEPPTEKEEDKTEETQPPQVKKKKERPPLPGGGMKREKTRVEQAAEISDSKKQEMISMMMREQTSMAMKINKEQTRQEELVKQLRDKRRRKMEARNEEAAALLGLGARQKTMVEDKKKTERERQIEQIRERVNRIKHERTIGAKESSRTPSAEPDTEGNEEDKSFANIAQDADHDKMEKLAQEMEKKFKESNSQQASAGESSKPESAAEDNNTGDEQKGSSGGRGKLDDKTRAQILKDRQKSKKANKRASIAAQGAASGVDDDENTV